MHSNRYFPGDVNSYSSSSNAASSSTTTISTSSDGAGGDALLAETTGFVAPLFGLMHCDTLQVFTKGCDGEDWSVTPGS